MNSIGDITKKIIDIENEHKLFSWEIDGVYIWEIIRYKIYLAAISNTFDKTKKAKKSFYAKAKSNINKYLYAIRHQPYTDFHNSDILIFESSRKLLFDGEYIDPYTKFIADELNDKGESISVYQSSYSFDRLDNNASKKFHLELPFFFASLRASRFNFKIDLVNKKKIKRMNEILDIAFNCSFVLNKLVESEIKLFKAKLIYFDKLFKRKKPKEIYIVNFCDKSALINSAKKANIIVKDIQHGLISSEDIIYHYPNVKKESLHYFPTMFYAWSDIWTKVTTLPLDDKNIKIIGNKYLQAQALKYANTQKNKKQILVISQPGLTDLIFEEVLKNIEAFMGYDILYKLHPNEYAIISDYANYDLVKTNKNVKFVEQKEDLYKLLAESEFVIGVSSTVLIEALEFKCKVLLFDLPGVEWMNPFVGEKIEMFQKSQLTKK